MLSSLRTLSNSYKNKNLSNPVSVTSSLFSNEIPDFEISFFISSMVSNFSKSCRANSSSCSANLTA